MAAAKKAAKHRPDKDHLVHGTNLMEVGTILRHAAKMPGVNQLSNEQVINLIANSISDVGEETRGKR